SKAFWAASYAFLLATLFVFSNAAFASSRFFFAASSARSNAVFSRTLRTIMFVPFHYGTAPLPSRECSFARKAQVRQAQLRLHSDVEQCRGYAPMIWRTMGPEIAN